MMTRKQLPRNRRLDVEHSQALQQLRNPKQITKLNLTIQHPE